MSAERYEIREKIGQGGVGAVYQAFDTQLNREVAIKRVLAEGGYEDQEEATKHLLKEATALSSVQHPHIVTVYDAGIDADGPYVIMELIHGRTLDEMVERGTLTWDDLREVALQTQEALIAAQDLDLVHRDLKPSNIMVCWLPSGKFQVKIVDFGLAKFSAAPSLQTIDHGDAVFGSIFFMAPEQFERTPLDKRTDMYAMGCLYYYALTGKHPFTGDTAAEVMASHLQHHVQPLHEVRPDIPKWGADWIMWHIERYMENRPTDAREALERFLILDKQSTQPITMTAPADLSTPASEPGKPKLIFPDTVQPAEDTRPATSAEPAQPPSSEPISLQQDAPSHQTAPQPIAPPNAGLSPHTKAQQISQKPEAQTATPDQPTNPTQPTSTPQPAGTPQITSTGITRPAPTQPEHQPPSGPAQKMDSAKKTMPAGAKWAIIGMLALVIVVAAIVMGSLSRDRKETEMVNEVMKEAKALNDEGKLHEGIELTEEQLKGVLQRTTSMESNKQRPILLKTIAFTKAKGGYTADDVILTHITTAKCPESIRAEFLKIVLSRRKNPDNIAPLLEFAKETTESNSATQAINAARITAEGHPADEYIDDFLTLINDTDSSTIRAAAERAANELIAASKQKESFTSAIYGSYESAVNDDAKFTMLRLLGSAGGNQAAEAVEAALASDNAPLRSAAIAALGRWADDSQFETLIAFIEECDDEKMRNKAFTAAYSFLSLDRKRAPEDIEDLWKSFAGTARTQREKLQIISGMAKQKNEWAIPVLEYFTEDDDDKVIDKAEQAKERLERRIREQEGRDDS